PRRLIVKDNRNSIRKEVLHLIKFVKKTVAIPIEQTDEDNIVDFFQNIDGLRTFKNNSLIYIQNKKKNKGCTDISLEYKKMEDLLTLYKKDKIDAENREKVLLKENERLKKKIEKNNNDKIRELSKLYRLN
ncbi:hypothetical protein SM3_02523, partial [Enterococcus faecium EnGen0176]|uniref:hypothetical protein n=4 Tax=Enterococcus faecium TaxID=1352 RepID=UPI00032E183E